MKNAADKDMAKQSKDERLRDGLCRLVCRSSFKCLTHLFLKHQAVLQLPGDFNQAAGPGIVFGLVDLTYRLLQPEQRLLNLGVRFRIIIDRCMATKIAEQEWVFTNSLDWLEGSVGRKSRWNTLEP